MATDFDALRDRLETFRRDVWDEEPADVAALRRLRKPPMGRLPGVFYANFNLFWCGENIQAVRELARKDALGTTALNTTLAALLRRHRGRLVKWGLADTPALLEDIAQFCDEPGCADGDEVAALCEALLVAVNRVQAWVDRMLPWARLDERLDLL